VVGQGGRDRAWTQRRQDLQHLAGVGDTLTDVDRRIVDLQERGTTLLDSETTT
jgi:hypothetical protein